MSTSPINHVTADGEGYPFTPRQQVSAVQAVRAERPSPVVASGVIGYIVAGFLCIAGFVALVGANALNGVVSSIGGTAHTAPLQMLGFANFVAAGLLIAGGVAVAGGKSSGRIMTTLATAIIAVCGLYWMKASGSATPWAFGFVAPALLATGFLWQSSVTRWLASARQHHAA